MWATSGGELSLSTNLALVAADFALSILSYAVVENPIRRARWSGRRTALVFAAATAVVLTGATMSLGAIGGEKARFYALNESPARSEVVIGRSSAGANAASEVVAAVQAARRNDPIPAGLTPRVGDLPAEPQPYALPRGCVPVASSNESRSLVCRVGRMASPRTIVLIGDSHAQMWLPAVVRLAERDGWLVIPLLRPGCTPDTWVDERGLEACRPWYRWATSQARLLHPDVTLIGGAVGGSRGADAAARVHGMLTMAKQLRSAGGRVIVMSDPEGLTEDPVDCLLSRHASMGKCTAIWPARRLKPSDRIALGTRSLGVSLLDTRPWFCFERRCPAVIGRTIVYRDYHHVTAAYVLHVAPTFRAAFGRLLRQ